MALEDVEPLELSCRLTEFPTDEGHDPTLEDLIVVMAPPGWSEAASRFIT